MTNQRISSISYPISPFQGRQTAAQDLVPKVDSIGRLSIENLTLSLSHLTSGEKLCIALALTAVSLICLFALVSNPVGWITGIVGGSALLAKSIFAGTIIGAEICFWGIFKKENQIPPTDEDPLAFVERMNQLAPKRETRSEKPPRNSQGHLPKKWSSRALVSFKPPRSPKID